MKKGDYISFKDNDGKQAEGVIVDIYTTKAKHIVNRGGFVELAVVLKPNGKLYEMVIADWHQFSIISKGNA